MTAALGINMSDFKKGTLTAQDEYLEIDCSPDKIGTVMVQYGASGAGTIEVRITLDKTTWIAVELTNVNDISVTATSITASGIWKADISGAHRVRAYKTVAGAGGVVVSLSYVN